MKVKEGEVEKNNGEVKLKMEREYRLRANLP
jgi:hypothetical protein